MTTKLAMLTMSGTAGVALMFSSCANLPKDSKLSAIPTGKKLVNDDLFKSQDSFVKRADSITKGMSIAQVASTMGVKENHFQVLNREETMKARYGSTFVSGNVENELNRTTAVTLRFAALRERTGMDYKTNLIESTTGSDQTFTAVFRDDKLTWSGVSGQAIVNEKDKTNILVKTAKAQLHRLGR